MSYRVCMSKMKSAIRWADVLAAKRGGELPFLRFYRDAGLVPESGRHRATPPPFIRPKPAL